MIKHELNEVIECPVVSAKTMQYWFSTNSIFFYLCIMFIFNWYIYSTVNETLKPWVIYFTYNVWGRIRNFLNFCSIFLLLSSRYFTPPINDHEHTLRSRVEVRIIVLGVFPDQLRLANFTIELKKAHFNALHL